MTAGFVCLGLGLVAFSVELRRRAVGAAWLAAGICGVATLGVALFPLETSAWRDSVHNALAALGYLSLAAIPVLAARAQSDAGHRRAAAASVATGVVAAACLAVTVAGPAHGLFQRAGLTVVDVWLVLSASAMVLGRDRFGRGRPEVW